MKPKKHTKLFEFQEKSRAGGICAKCGMNKEMLNVDHIIPVSFLANVGLLEERYSDGENMQLVCRVCNINKAGQFDLHNPKTIPLLKKYTSLLEEMSK